MSAGATGAVGPVSVRYAAQIRELLFAQALRRMAAEQEAARADEQRQAQVQSAQETKPGSSEPHAPASQSTGSDAGHDRPDRQEGPAPAARGAGQLVDLQA